MRTDDPYKQRACVRSFTSNASTFHEAAATYWLQKKTALQMHHHLRITLGSCGTQHSTLLPPFAVQCSTLARCRLPCSTVGAYASNPNGSSQGKAARNQPATDQHQEWRARVWAWQGPPAAPTAGKPERRVAPALTSCPPLVRPRTKALRALGLAAEPERVGREQWQGSWTARKR